MSPMNAYEAARVRRPGEVIVFDPANPERYDVIDQIPMWREDERRWMGVRALLLAEPQQDEASLRELAHVDRRLNEIRSRLAAVGETEVSHGD